MNAIPETGGGFSGLFADGLWRVYRYFPFQGQWDWLLLFLLLVGLAHLLYIPHLWRSVGQFVTYLKAHRIGQINETGNAYFHFSLLSFGSMFFLTWFFHTESGRTLLAGRVLFGLSLVDSHRSAHLASLAVCLGATIGLLCLHMTADKRDSKLMGAGTQVYPDRSLLSLFGQGGVYVHLDEDGKRYVQTLAGGFAFWNALLLTLLHVFYWGWSVASLTFFVCYLMMALLMEMVRMIFVAIRLDEATKG